MIKIILLMIGIATLLLNMLLTYYVIREKGLLQIRAAKEHDVVNFDLTPMKATGLDTEDFAIKDTEIISEYIQPK